MGHEEGWQFSKCLVGPTCWVDGVMIFLEKKEKKMLLPELGPTLSRKERNTKRLLIFFGEEVGVENPPNFVSFEKSKRQEYPCYFQKLPSMLRAKNAGVRLEQKNHQRTKVMPTWMHANQKENWKGLVMDIIKGENNLNGIITTTNLGWW